MDGKVTLKYILGGSGLRVYHHHRLEPELGPGLPFLGFLNNDLSMGLDC
jgi:hypothetical protein